MRRSNWDKGICTWKGNGSSRLAVGRCTCWLSGRSGRISDFSYLFWIYCWYPGFCPAPQHEPLTSPSPDDLHTIPLLPNLNIVLFSPTAPHYTLYTNYYRYRSNIPRYHQFLYNLSAHIFALGRARDDTRYEGVTLFVSRLYGYTS